MSTITASILTRSEVASEITARTIIGGLKWGAIGGAVFGTFVFPIIGTVVGGLFGGVIGSVIGCLLGIVLVVLTVGVHYPLGDKRAYAWNTYVVSSALTFFCAFFTFAAIFSENNFTFSFLTSLSSHYNLNMYTPIVITVLTTCLLARKLIAWYSSLLFMKQPSPRHQFIQRWSVPLISVAATTLIAGILFGLPFSL